MTTIDSEKTTAAAQAGQEAPKPKGGRKRAKAAKPREEGGKGEKGPKARDRTHQQEGGSDCYDETRQGRDAARDHGRHQLAGPHPCGAS